MSRANTILDILEGLDGNHILDVYLSGYQNGRESGYALKQFCSKGDKQVAFAENRNSDDTVVYFGKTLDFNFSDNVPSEKVYKKAVYFRFDKVQDAAEAIFEYLR